MVCVILSIVTRVIAQYSRAYSVDPVCRVPRTDVLFAQKCQFQGSRHHCALAVVATTSGVAAADRSMRKPAPALHEATVRRHAPEVPGSNCDRMSGHYGIVSHFPVSGHRRTPYCPNG